MRILHVIGSLAPRYGGPSAVVSEMARALMPRGHYVEIFTTNVDGDHRLQVPTSRPVEWRGVPTTFFPVHWPRPYAASIGLGATLRRRVHEFDVVHVHSLFLFHTEAAGRYCSHRSVPYILRPHGVLNPYHRSQHRWRKAIHTTLLGRRTINAAAGLHFTSAMEHEHARSLRLGVPAFIVPLGVDTSELHRPVDAEQLLGWQPQLTGQTLVTYVGRLAPKKRLDLLVEAFALVARVHRDTHLVLAGPDDGAGSRLRTQIERLGIGTRVTLPGLITGERKTALLQGSRIFAMPSEDENFGVSVVEAMAVGLPVVTTAGVAIHREIAAARAGLVVPLASHALSESIAWLLADRGRCKSMGENGRALSGSSFAWATIAPRLERMYHQAVGRPADRLAWLGGDDR